MAKKKGKLLECQVRANLNYLKSTSSIHLHFHKEKDKDILAYLNKQENKTDYIRQLILKDIKGRG